jgi:hypothetical protein
MATTSRSVTLYKHSAIVHWLPEDSCGRRRRKKRGKITSQSAKSLRAAGFAFGNALADWALMGTFTFRTEPERPKLIWRYFRECLYLLLFPGAKWGWWMEFTQRELVHFHCLFGADVEHHWTRDGRGSYRLVERRHGPTSVLSGLSADWIVGAWCHCVGDSSLAFQRFQNGGIVEKLRDPTAAGFYPGREAGKRQQKKLPDKYQGLGSWWWLSPEARPQGEGTLRVDPTKLVGPWKIYWDKRAVLGAEFSPS